MKISDLHSWNVTPQEASKIQRELRSQVITYNDFGPIRFIAGADIALDTDREEAYGGVIVYEFPRFLELERRSAKKKITFPYIPGLLAFREAPVLLDVFASLTHEPDLVILDGQGIAHPRGVGIASHIGLLLNKPTIGCAKSRLIGTHGEPGPKKGDWTELRHSGQLIGAVLRTRDGVQPIYVSIGHKIDLETSMDILLQCADGYRVPRPTREADHFVEEVKRKDLEGGRIPQRELFEL